MYFYEVLQSIMDEKSLKISDVSRLSGLTDSTVRSIISRKNKTVALEVAFKLARGLDVPITRLNGEDSRETEKSLTKHENAITQKEMDIINKYHYLSSSVKKLIEHVIDEEYKRWKSEQYKEELKEEKIPARIIPYYQRIASAGSGQFVFDDLPNDKIGAPDIPKYSNADYAVGVNGNSMDPYYKDGDTVLVEQTNVIEKGEVGIFIEDGDAFIKELGDCELVSRNSNYPNIPITHNTKCLGRVIGKLDSSSEAEDEIDLDAYSAVVIHDLIKDSKIKEDVG